jgi:DNA polymerase I
MKKPAVHIIKNADRAAFQQAVDDAGERAWVIDTETNGLMVRSGLHTAKLIGLTPVGTSACFIWERGEFERQGIREVVAGLHLIGHNVRFDFHALGIVPDRWDDTMLHLAHTCTSQPLSLDDQARAMRWAKIKTSPLLKSRNKWEENRIADMDVGQLDLYLWDDCVFTGILWQRIQKSPWADMDRRTENAVRRMEARGVRLYADGLAEFERLGLAKLDDAVRVLDAYGFAGGNFNSPQQVGAWLVGQGTKLKRNPKTKNWKTDKVSLQRLADDGDEKVIALFAARTAHKLGVSLVSNLTSFREAEGDGCIYPSVRTTGARTGRFSYSDPPLQQIPKHDTVLGPAARRMFGARDGYTAGADFSQVELRVIAALSNEPVLLEAFAQGRDPHAETAAGMFGVELANVSEQQRFSAKAINFGIPNGMKERRLAVILKCSTAEATRYLNNHRAALPTMHDWMARTWEEGERYRVVSTLSGRTRVFTAGESTLPSVSQKMQGTAAELMRAALIAVDEAGCEPIMSVHDEIITQSPLHKGIEVARIMQEAANAAFPDELGAVDFVAAGGEGTRWADVH